MNQVIKVRASSWGSLFNCAYSWEGVHLLGIKSPSGPRALLGTAIHAGTAAFDTARVNGAPIDPVEAAEQMLQELRFPEYEVDWHGADITPKQAERTGLALLSLYCTEVSPRYEFVAVEMETKPMLIDCGDGITIQLTGTLDRARIRKENDRIGISDVKTGGAAVVMGVAKTAPHRAQIGTYELLFEHTSGIAITAPADIIGLRTKGAPEYGIGEITGARDLMVGTEDYPGLIQIGAQMFRSGLFPPNPQAHTCSQQYCPRWSSCPYHA